MALAAVAILVMGVVFLRHDFRSPSCQRFFWFSLALTHYFACFTLTYLSRNAETALFCVRISYVAVPLIPMLLLNFVLSLQDRRPGTGALLVVGWSLGGIFVILALTTNWLIAGADLRWWGFYTRYGSLGWLFISYYLVCAAICAAYYRRLYKLTPPGTRGQLRLSLHMWALLVGGLMTVDFLAAFGLSVYPFGYLGALTLAVMILLAMRFYGHVFFSPMLSSDTLLETMGEALFVIDDDNVIRTVNRAAERLLEQPRQTLVGQPLVMLLPIEAFQHGAIQFLSSGGPRSFEASLTEKAGRTHYLEISGSLLTDSRGNSVGAAFIMRDLTQERLAQQALRRVEQEEARFRATFDQAPIGAAMVSLDGRFLRVNDALCRISAYTAEELTALDQSELIHPDDLDEGTDQALQLIAGQTEQYTRELRYLRKDGQQAWVHLSVRLVKDPSGRPHYFLQMVEDITERKLAREALDRVNRLLNHTQALAKVGGWEYEIATGQLSWTDQVYQIHGLRPEQGPGDPKAAIQYYAPKARPVLEDAFYRCVEQGQPYDLELQFIRANGETAWVRTVGHPTWEDGKVVRLSGHIMDITERKRAEAEKERLESQLRHAQKLQALGVLTGGIAHEFNNLLAIIMGYAELGREREHQVGGKTSDMDRILSAAERGKTLVKQMLAFSRKSDAAKKPQSLNQVVANAVQMLERTLPKSVDVIVDLAPALPLVSCDASQVEQIVINLVTNARDAMQGRGTLRISTGFVSLPETVCSVCGETFSGGHVQLAIADTGQGMDRQTMEKIYDPFFTTKGVGHGTGLGLSMLLGIVHNHAAHISCTSETGLGTTFKIHFPQYAGAAVSSEDGPTTGSQVQGGAETVLLVDDEEAIRSLGEQLLQDAGYHVMKAGSGEEALEIYRAWQAQIDLVVLDIGMPGLGGLWCLEKILAEDPAAKVIVASGYADMEQINSTLKLGASAFLAKPYKLADMLVAVRDCLDRPKMSN